MDAGLRHVRVSMCSGSSASQSTAHLLSFFLLSVVLIHHLDLNHFLHCNLYWTDIELVPGFPGSLLVWCDLQHIGLPVRNDPNINCMVAKSLFFVVGLTFNLLQIIYYVCSCCRAFMCTCAFYSDAEKKLKITICVSFFSCCTICDDGIWCIHVVAVF